MALWSILAAPLIMGNDLRKVSSLSKSILLNRDAIKVNQDPLGKMGRRLNTTSATQLWARELDDGDVAVALYNKNGGAPAGITLVAVGMYCANATGVKNGSTSFGYSVMSCRDAVIANPQCDNGHGIFYYSESYNGQCSCAVDDCSKHVPGVVYNIYKVDPGVSSTGIDISFDFTDVGLFNSGPIDVHDIWTGKTQVSLEAYTAKAVPFHGTAFLRLSKNGSKRTPEMLVV